MSKKTIPLDIYFNKPKAPYELDLEIFGYLIMNFWSDLKDGFDLDESVMPLIKKGLKKNIIKIENNEYVFVE